MPSAIADVLDSPVLRARLRRVARQTALAHGVARWRRAWSDVLLRVYPLPGG